jgi:glycerophosphoryl diester phosphodiesterase
MSRCAWPGRLALLAAAGLLLAGPASARILSVAHKGSYDAAPEHTVPAYEHAFTTGGADWAECDLRATSDGVLVCQYLDDITAVSSCPGRLVSQSTLAQLQQCDFGCIYAPQFCGTTIATVEEVLAVAAQHDRKILFDVKFFATGKAQQIRQILDAHSWPQDLVLQWNRIQGEPQQSNESANWKQWLPGSAVVYGANDATTFPESAIAARAAAGDLAIAAPLFSLSEPWVDLVHAHGLLVYAYLEIGPQDYDEVLAWKADAVMQGWTLALKNHLDAIGCQDGLDDDGDGAVDWGGDPGCIAPLDDSERQGGLVCDDGVDNDQDGQADFPADAGCQGTSAAREDPACHNGVDDDGDGGTDWDGAPRDPDCYGRPWKDSEAPGANGALNVAHRGGLLVAPEHTLAAYDLALDNGSDWIECDVQKSADGVVVCIHDATVDRTTDGTGTVASKTLAQLQALDAGSWFSPAFAGERIPTLAEALQVAQGRGLVLVDPKIFPIGPDVKAVLASLSLPDDAIAVWTDFTAMANDLRAQVPGAKVLLRSSTLASLADAEALAQTTLAGPYYGVAPFTNNLTDDPVLGQQMVDLFHGHGLPVLPFVANSAGVLEALLDLGSDGVVTQDPATLTGVLVVTACENGADDDGDGQVDLADPGCRDAADGSERGDCADGLDNDGDGAIDYLGDPGCSSALEAAVERPECSNGVDDDGDGLVDYPADLTCKAAFGADERVAPSGGSCGLLGVEALLPLLLAARRAARRPFRTGSR